MKYFILVCVLLATAFAAPTVDEEKIKQSENKVKAAHDECNADPALHIDFKAIRKAHQEGKHEEPANLGDHTLCVSKKLGWQHEDGSVNEEVVRSRAEALSGDNPKINEIVNECIQAKSTPQETAKHLFECYRKNAPHSTSHGHHHD